MSQIERFTMESKDKSELKVIAEGSTKMPFFKDDLKFKAAIELMSTVDESNFIESGLSNELSEYIELMNSILHRLDPFND